MPWPNEEKSYSQRRASGLIGLLPKTYRYASRRSDDTDLRARLKALASERRRFGYRRLDILLKREGVVLKKLFRLYREERLTVRRRGGRKRALGTQAPMTLPQGPNQRWTGGNVNVDQRRRTGGQDAASRCRAVPPGTGMQRSDDRPSWRFLHPPRRTGRPDTTGRDSAAPVARIVLEERFVLETG